MEIEVETVETLSDEAHSPFSYVLAVFSFIFIILSIYLWLFQISAIIYRYVQTNNFEFILERRNIFNEISVISTFIIGKMSAFQTNPG